MKAVEWKRTTWLDFTCDSSPLSSWYIHCNGLKSVSLRGSSTHTHTHRHTHALSVFLSVFLSLFLSFSLSISLVLTLAHSFTNQSSRNGKQWAEIEILFIWFIFKTDTDVYWAEKTIINTHKIMVRNNCIRRVRDWIVVCLVNWLLIGWLIVWLILPYGFAICSYPIAIWHWRRVAKQKAVDVEFALPRDHHQRCQRVNTITTSISLYLSIYLSISFYLLLSISLSIYS